MIMCDNSEERFAVFFNFNNHGGWAIADVKAISTGATARARDPCTDKFRPPASKYQTVIFKTVASSTAGAIEATPNYACIYVLHVHGQLWVQLGLPMAMVAMDRRKACPSGH